MPAPVMLNPALIGACALLATADPTVETVGLVSEGPIGERVYYYAGPGNGQVMICPDEPGTYRAFAIRGEESVVGLQTFTMQE